MSRGRGREQGNVDRVPQLIKVFGTEYKRHNYEYDDVGDTWGEEAIPALALSLFRGATVRQMPGSYADMMELHRRRKLLRSVPHRSAGVAACFDGAGGGDRSGIWNGCCTGTPGFEVSYGGGGGPGLSLSPASVPATE